MNVRIYTSESSPESAPEPGEPLSGNPRPAGFPSPADDYLESVLDLNKSLIKNPTSTFFGRVSGFSLKDAGIDNGDLLVIDKSLKYKKGALAVCFIDGEFTLKRIKTAQDKIFLMPPHSDDAPIVLSKESEFMIWGIVTHVVKKVF